MVPSLGRYLVTNITNARTLSRTEEAVPHSGGLKVAQGVLEPSPGRVQPTLDRADGAREPVAHLLQRLTLEVEGFQRFAVHPPQRLQTGRS